jgi:hypothetical protein
VKPDLVSLGEYNVKYIIASYPITDKNLSLQKKVDGYFIYQNSFFKPRFNLPVMIYHPNLIRLDSSKNRETDLNISLIYNPNWKVYADGHRPARISERPNALSTIDSIANSTFIDIRYESDQFKIGAFITAITVAGCLLILAKSFLNKEI